LPPNTESGDPAMKAFQYGSWHTLLTNRMALLQGGTAASVPLTCSNYPIGSAALNAVNTAR